MKRLRLENALWGLFISDSLSMPAHWYYKRDYLKKEFGAITNYNDAPHPHPESFMVGNVDYDSASKRLFVTSSATNSVMILNVSDASNIVKVKDIALNSYGTGINSVSVYNGKIAVAVERSE
jgi:hypothetical protein